MQNYNSKLKTDVKQRAYTYALEVIKFIEKLPRDAVCEIIGKQLLRSATSVGANIVEARASSSKRDFTNFYTYALKSINESGFWIDLLCDSGKAMAGEISHLVQETGEIGNMIASSILTLKGRR